MQSLLESGPRRYSLPREALRWRRTAYRSKPLQPRDPVTGLFTRETHEEELVKAFKRAARQAAVLGVVFLEWRPSSSDDLEEESPRRDCILQAIARTLLSTTRAEDCVARYGADAFCITVIAPSAEAVRSLAWRCHAEVGSLLDDDEEAHVLGLSTAAVWCLPNRNRCTFESFLRGMDEAIEEARGREGLVLRSLLTESDVTLLREVERRLFRRFLSDRGFLPTEGAGRLSKTVSSGPCMGRLARRLGWLGPRRLRRILLEQRRTHEMFGACAVRLGYLRPEHVFGLLALQRENPRDLLRVLCQEGAIDEFARRRILAEYQAFLRGDH